MILPQVHLRNGFCALERQVEKLNIFRKAHFTREREDDRIDFKNSLLLVIALLELCVSLPPIFLKGPDHILSSYLAQLGNSFLGK